MLSHLLDLVLRSFQLYKNLLSFSELFSTLIFNLLKYVYFLFQGVWSLLGNDFYCRLAKSSSSLSEEMQVWLHQAIGP